MEASQAATQAQVDADIAAITQIGTDLTNSVQTIQAELDALKTANPTVDLSGLEAAIAPLDDQAKAVGQLTPSQPAPPAPAPGA